MTKFTLMLAAILCCGFCAASETGKKEKLSAEEKQAQAEEAAESKLDQEMVQRRFEGKLELFQQADPNAPAVAGTFTSSGRIFLLKLTDPNQRTRLKDFDGKLVTLMGKIRNEGKYFVYTELVEGGSAPIERRKRGGI